MSKNFILGVLLLLVASCNNEQSVNKHDAKTYAPVRVCVNDFSVSVDEFSPATTRSTKSVAEYDGIQAITLSFYDAQDNVTYQQTQLKGDQSTFTTFGTFNCNLPLGNYTMVVVARDVRDNDVLTLTSKTQASYTSDFARETFVASQNVAVNNASPINLNVTLNRIVAALAILTTDTRPDGVAKFRTTFSAGSKSFNPTTGQATDNAGFSIVNTPSAEVGQTVGLGSFLFLDSDEQTMDVTIETLNATDEVLSTRIVKNVPFKRNRRTTLRGAIFTTQASTAATFMVEIGWLSAIELDF